MMRKDLRHIPVAEDGIPCVTTQFHKFMEQELRAIVLERDSQKQIAPPITRDEQKTKYQMTS